MKPKMSRRSKPKLHLIQEPQLLFNYEQATEDPRDGLTLFGPLEHGKPYGIRFGIVGTPDGIRRFREWVSKAQLPIGDMADIARPGYPGFEPAFGIPWNPTCEFELAIDATELHRRINFADAHHRVYKAVDLYEEAILKVVVSEESPVDIWFVVVPDEVYRNCRPKSAVAASSRISSTSGLSVQDVRDARRGQSLLFENELATELSKAYEFEVNFHNQLKARLLRKQIITQVVRESTIAYDEILNDRGKPMRDLSKVQQDIAWHLATAAFYKSGGRPWKIAGVREGVCYIGIVFKHVESSENPKWPAAQRKCS
jgi:hypothetical protein